MPIRVIERRTFNLADPSSSASAIGSAGTGAAAAPTPTVGAAAGVATAGGAAPDATAVTVSDPGMFLGTWDGARGQAGVETAMVNAVGWSRPPALNTFARGYSGSTMPGSHPTTFAGTSVANAASTWNARAMLNMKLPDIATLDAGGYDSLIEDFWASWPVEVTGWVFINHEFGNDDRASEAAIYRSSTARYVHVAAPVIRSRGLNAGVGGLNMQFDWAAQTGPRWPTYAWWRNLDPGDGDVAVFGLDIYAKHLTNPVRGEDIVNGTEGLLAIWDTVQAESPIRRIIIGETALDKRRRNFSEQIIGDDDTIAAWIPGYVDQLDAVPGLEAVCYFHAPSGPASQYAQLQGAALTTWSTEVAGCRRV